MKIQTALLLGVLISLATGCKKDDETEDALAISIGPSSPYVLPVGLRSCKGESTGAATADLSENTIEFTRFKYNWTGTSTYTMSAIFLRFTSSVFSGGKYECTLAGDELSLILPAAGRVLDPGEGEQTARCSLRCGGIKVNSGVSNAFIPGVIKIVGIETDENGDSRPVVVQTDVSMTYQKF